MTGAQQLTEQVRRASKAEGRVEGKAEAVLSVLGRRGLQVTDAQRTMVLACADVATLERWLDRAIVAERAEDVFS
jgi:hypothetical protein